MSLEQSVVERMGRADFSRDSFLHARDLAWDALREVAAQVKAGMNEADIQSLLKDALAARGSEKPWHKPVVRIGSDTVKTFHPLSDPDLRLAETDIFFLDIGPVWDGYEADVGDSFVLGQDAEMIRCAADCRVLFEIVRREWLESGRSGSELYRFADQQAKERGWQLVLEVDGHRLGDFPHHAHYRGGMSEVDFRPSADAWVLEIQLRHPTREFGAFYEDLLLSPA